MSQTIRQRVRDAVMNLRRTPMPIGDLIPLLHACADTVEKLEAERNDLLLQLDKSGIKETVDELAFVRAEVAKKDAEIKTAQFHALSLCTEIDKLTAERDSLAKKVEVLREALQLADKIIPVGSKTEILIRAALEATK